MKKKLFILTILVALLSVSCDDFLDVNTDPNNPTVVSPDLVLPVGQVYTAKVMQQDRGINHLGNMMMYNWSETYGFSWYGDEFRYNVTSVFYDQLFDDTYSSTLKQYQDLTDLGEDYGHYKGIAAIMKAFHFQLMVDFYGDIPYSEALLRGANPTPAYDDAATIYEDLLVQLEDAITMIKAADALSTSVEPGADDAMFGGNSTSWIQFANTLKIRILTRASDVWPAATIAAEVATINAEGSGFIGDDVAVQPGFVNEESKQNWYWAELGWKVDGTVVLSNDATCATQWILDYLNGLNDPRINFMYEEPATGHLGVDQGLNVGDEYGADFVSNIGPGHLKAADMEAVIFTLAEHHFNMAELAFKGFAVPGDAETHFNLGIQASFDYLGAGSSASYISQSTPNVNFANSPNKIEAIITQKWLATNGITAEQSWFDYSRTGYPAGLPVSNLASTPDRPVRLAYPASEITANTANVPAQPDVFNTKIFWAN